MVDLIGFNPLIIVKVIILAFIGLIAVISFIFFYQIHSLNKVITILASFSSGVLHTLAIAYFIAITSLFFLALVIL